MVMMRQSVHDGWTPQPQIQEQEMSGNDMSMRDTPRCRALDAYQGERGCEDTRGDYQRAWTELAFRLEEELVDARKDIESLLLLIGTAAPGAFANGNTHPDGHGPDEGEVLAGRMYTEIVEKYKFSQFGLTKPQSSVESAP